MRILICGDREWEDTESIERLLSKFDESTVVIHGDSRGADRMAGSIAESRNMTVEKYPADWHIGRIAGPIRNRRMIEEGKPDVVYYFHHDIRNSLGTKDMIKQSKAAKIPVISGIS